MTAYGPGEQPGMPAYQGPPPTGDPSQPLYPAQPTYPYGYPQAPGYGYPPGPYPAYPPYPPVGYPMQLGPRRPGTATAAGVLAFVNGGLLILAGALLLFGGSIASDIEDSTNSSTHVGTELVLDGLVNFLAAGLLIAGGVALMGRKPSGRTMMGIGGGIVLASTVYWLVRFDKLPTSGFVTWAVIFAALTVVGLALVATRAVTEWLRAPGP